MEKRERRGEKKVGGEKWHFLGTELATEKERTPLPCWRREMAGGGGK